MTDQPASLAGKLAGYHDLLDQRLGELVAGRAPVARLYDMIAYHLGWRDHQLRPCAGAAPGKRLRPAVCFLACEATGGSARPALPAAAAVELIHNFTLVHDDIQDRSWLRRHRRTVWSLWGVADAINVGDGLFTLAQLAIMDDRVPPELAGVAARTLNRACLALCEGQMVDLHLGSARDLTLDRYLEMIRAKTGALFGCAAELGGLFGGGSATAMRDLHRVGMLLGEAYQMQDDLLGVWGENSKTGKPANDVRERKRSMAAVLACERATGGDRTRLYTLYSSPGPLSDQDVAWVVELFDRLGLRTQINRMVQTRLRRVETLVRDSLPAGAAQRDLLALVAQVAKAQVPDRPA